MLYVREENLNVMLAELLAESGLKAIGEVRLRRRMPDVMLDVNGIRIILEGKKPGNRAVLREQAVKRIEEGLADIVVMVEYVKIPLPSKLSLTQIDIKNALLRGTFNIGVLTFIELAGLEKWMPIAPRRLRSEFYESVGFSDLLAHIMTAYDYVVREDIIGPVVNKIDELLNNFSRMVLVSGVNVERLKKVLELEGERDEREEE